MNFWDLFLANVDNILEAIGAASILASFTKTKWDNRVLNWAAAAVQFVALNFKPAKAALENKRVIIEDKSIEKIKVNN